MPTEPASECNEFDSLVQPISAAFPAVICHQASYSLGGVSLTNMVTSSIERATRTIDFS